MTQVVGATWARPRMYVCSHIGSPTSCSTIQGKGAIRSSRPAARAAAVTVKEEGIVTMVTPGIAAQSHACPRAIHMPWARIRPTANRRR